MSNRNARQALALGASSARLGIALLALGAASSLEAQTTVRTTIPNEFSDTEGPTSVHWAATPFASRHQLIVNANQLKGHAGLRLTELAVRRSASLGSALDAGRLWIEVRVSNTSASTTAPSLFFGANRGKDDKIVFARVVNFPPAPVKSTRPAKWDSPHATFLALHDTSFVYKGGNLCIETRTLLRPPASKAPQSPPWWALDGSTDTTAGKVQNIGKSCISDMPGTPAGAEPRSLAIGGSAYFFLHGVDRSGVGILAAGTRSMSLDLSALGAPGCRLYNDAFFVTPSLFAAHRPGRHSTASAMLPLPADSRLVGARLFAQWIVTDPKGNKLGLSTSNGLAVQLTRARNQDFAWIESTDVTAPSGRVILGRAPVIRLSFEK